MQFRRMRIEYPFKNADLTTRFAIHSFICIGIMSVVLWFIVSHYMINEILDREWETTAAFIRTEVKEFLTAEDFKTKDRKSVGHKFEQLLQHITLMPNIVRFKVYNPKGIVIWSDDKRLVGKSFSDNNDLQQAIGGNVVADVSSLNKKKNTSERAAVQRSVEVYVPVYSENQRELLGVFETYKKADAIYRDILNARIAVLIGAVGGGLLLYLSLLVIVRQAAKKIEEQQADLLKMQSELLASQRMAAVGEMAAAVAHGIGNPLSSIRAAAQVAMLDCDSQNEDQPGNRAKESLRSIIQQVDRVQKRMQGLLNFAKPLVPHPVPVEINALVRDVVETLRPRFEEASVTSHLDLDSSLPKSTLDANHIEQAFMGLITNAVEATPKGGRVIIRTKVYDNGGNNGNVIVSIEDTGDGIPIENREQVFEPFFTTKPQGTGIGLALAKKFVERNGGTISIAEASNGGTRIDVKFPSQGQSERP
jgi:two-component system, NtrC family, sensor histidine kinase HydH